MRLLAVLLCLIPLAAGAQPLPPALMQVTGVSAQDVLNVRALPKAASDDIGDLSNGTLVEITAVEGNWARIPWEGGNGWISLRYLREVERGLARDSDMPLGLECSGTEPFWSAALTPNGGFGFDSGDGDTFVTPIVRSTNSSVYGSEFAFVTAGNAYTGVLKAQQCDDGMSERLYGWHLDLVVHRRGVLWLYSGCCTAAGGG